MAACRIVSCSVTMPCTAGAKSGGATITHAGAACATVPSANLIIAVTGPSDTSSCHPGLL
jgi:hypothetical protein